MQKVQQKTYSVFELNNKIEQIVEKSFSGLIWVRGETSGFDKQRNNTHIYFQLQEKHPGKDEAISVISATLFSSDLKKVRQKLQEAGVAADLRDGIEVRVFGKVDVYPPLGKYSLIIRDIDPVFTLGKLAQSRDIIIKYLKSKGLLERNKMVPLPLVPLSVGLITQTNTEGYNDFLNKLQESGFAFKVKFYNSSVQGKKVEQEIYNALDYFERQRNVDIVVITRGGGSKSDLSWFDNKKIAEKIASLRTPVLTGIGHKTDLTVTDMVACCVQQSPSSAATFLVDKIKSFLQEINEVSLDITYSTKSYLELAGREIEGMKSQITRESLLFLKNAKEDLDRTRLDFPPYCKYFFESIKDIINGYKFNIDYADPINSIKRGFSITRVNGKALKSIENIKKGQDIVSTLSDGDIKSTVNKIIRK